MDLIPFVKIFPEQGAQETRTITTRGHETLPDDEYALVESYCDDPECDCRRVMLNVVGRGQAGKGFLASISFGFDRDADMAGPYLDPLNPQSKYAPVFLDLVGEMLAHDRAYVARLERHYRQIKEAAADPAHPAHPAILRARGQTPPASPSPRRQPRRNIDLVGSTRQRKKRRKH